MATTGDTNLPTLQVIKQAEGALQSLRVAISELERALGEGATGPASQSEVRATIEAANDVGQTFRLPKKKSCIFMAYEGHGFSV
jgi:pheromone shutdown protein TraB